MAVRRNKIKRWIRNIFKLHSLNGGFVVVVRSGFFERGFNNMSEELGGSLEAFKIKTKDK